MTAPGSKEKKNDSGTEELHEPHSFIFQRLKSSGLLAIFLYWQWIEEQSKKQNICPNRLFTFIGLTALLFSKKAWNNGPRNHETCNLQPWKRVLLSL